MLLTQSSIRCCSGFEPRYAAPSHPTGAHDPLPSKSSVTHVGVFRDDSILRSRRVRASSHRTSLTSPNSTLYRKFFGFSISTNENHDSMLMLRLRDLSVKRTSRRGQKISSSNVEKLLPEDHACCRKISTHLWFLSNSTRDFRSTATSTSPMRSRRSKKTSENSNTLDRIQVLRTGIDSLNALHKFH